MSGMDRISSLPVSQIKVIVEAQSNMERPMEPDLNRQVAEAQGWHLLRCTKSTYGGTVWEALWFPSDAPLHAFNATHGWFEGFQPHEYPRPLWHEHAYTPTTDLNQAVAFAEWFLQSQDDWCFVELSLLGYHPEGSRPCVGYEVEIYKQNAVGQLAEGTQISISRNNPAEALCRAVLQALGKL